MLLCDLSRCDEPAVALIHFRGLNRPVPYCEQHGFNRYGTPRFGHMERGAWVSPVCRVERINHEGDIDE